MIAIVFIVSSVIHKTFGSRLIVRKDVHQWWPTRVPRHTSVKFRKSYEPYAVCGFDHGLTGLNLNVCRGLKNVGHYWCTHLLHFHKA